MYLYSTISVNIMPEFWVMNKKTSHVRTLLSWHKESTFELYRYGRLEDYTHSRTLKITGKFCIFHAPTVLELTVQASYLYVLYVGRIGYECCCSINTLLTSTMWALQLYSHNMMLKQGLHNMLWSN